MERQPGGITVIVRRSGVPIRADYWGGAYVELTFGSETFHPTEVINVWDYETDKAEISLDKQELRATVRGWMKTNDAEWPEWLTGYMENAR